MGQKESDVPELGIGKYYTTQSNKYIASKERYCVLHWNEGQHVPCSNGNHIYSILPANVIYL